MDERKIPKIVLKINRNEVPIEQVAGSNSSNSNSNSIFSAKAAEVAKEFYKVDKNVVIPFSVLLKRVNQNAYKSIENVLELMGRMNDVERKKTLFQVLSRLRDVYTKLHLILEWTKVSSEHLSLKAIKTSAIGAKDNLNRLIGGFHQNSSSILTRKHAEANFDAFKELLLSSDRLPSYFPPSIQALAPVKQQDSLTELDRECWLSTLDSLLRFEISRNLLNIPRNDFQFISISEGKGKLLFLNLFEFEFTIVPIVEGDGLCPAWFILGVNVDSMKEVFKNSLTGIFQFKHNNVQTSDSEYFKTVLLDCQKYINLFYYEKLFSQFYFLSNSLGKSICSFKKGPQGDWFKISTWFFGSDADTEEKDKEIHVSITKESNFIVNNPSPLSQAPQALFVPSISFDEDEAKSIFENLFIEFYMKKLELFLGGLKEKDCIMNYEVKSKFCYDLLLFEDFKLKITINPLTKKYKFDFISSSRSMKLEIISISTDHLEEALIKFDNEMFTERMTEIIREFIVSSVNTKSESESESRPECAYRVVNCPEVSGQTGICFQLKSLKSCFSVDLSTNLVKYWKFKLIYSNGFLDIKFEDYEVTKKSQIPKTRRELFTFLEEEGTFLKGLATKNSFEAIIKSSGIEGEFEKEDTFKIYSFGLPTCVTGVKLIVKESGSISGTIEYASDPNSEASETLDISSKDDDFDLLMRIIKNSIKLLTIWEGSNILSVKVEIDSLNPVISLKVQDNKTISISEDCGRIFVNGGNDFKELEQFIESDSFSIYEFLDRLNDEGQVSKFDEDKSSDLTWLSESFM